MENRIIKQISLDLIDDPQIAMRQNLDDPDLEILMSDMQEVGLLEPIVVRPVGGRYEVIAGHRRTRSARLLKWPTIEAKIIEATDDEAFTMRCVENLSRKDVDPVDEAVFVGEIMLRHNKNEAEISKMLRRSEHWVHERLEVFEMPDYMKDHLKHKRYPLGAALWIFRIENEAARRQHATWASVNGVSVAGAKMWYQNLKARKFNFDTENVEIKDEGGSVQRVRKVVPCDRCTKDVFLDEADNVWVHRNCQLEQAPPREIPEVAPTSSENLTDVGEK